MSASASRPQSSTFSAHGMRTHSRSIHCQFVTSPYWLGNVAFVFSSHLVISAAAGTGMISFSSRALALICSRLPSSQRNADTTPRLPASSDCTCGTASSSGASSRRDSIHDMRSSRLSVCALRGGSGGSWGLSRILWKINSPIVLIRFPRIVDFEVGRPSAEGVAARAFFIPAELFPCLLRGSLRDLIFARACVPIVLE